MPSHQFSDAETPSTNRKKPLAANDVVAIIRYLHRHQKLRDSCLFSMAVDTMLRSHDLLHMRVGDVMNSRGEIWHRVQLAQQKTQQIVTVSLTVFTRQIVSDWIQSTGKKSRDWLFTDMRGRYLSRPLTTSHYRSLVKQWVSAIGLDPRFYSTHSLRRTKPTLVYQQYRDVEVCRLLLGHASVASTSHYLGIEMSDALDVAEAIQIFPESFHSTENLS